LTTSQVLPGKGVVRYDNFGRVDLDFRGGIDGRESPPVSDGATPDHRRPMRVTEASPWLPQAAVTLTPEVNPGPGCSRMSGSGQR
jgi:hypothetical protein